MYVVYAIKSLQYNYIYVGITDNISRRIGEHNNGHTKSTKYYRPFSILYIEEVGDRKEARIREKYWKSGIGKQKLKSM